MRPSGSAATHRLFVMSDSTAISRSVALAPMAGWSQVLPLFLGEELEVVDCSRDYGAMKTFFERGRLDWVLNNIRPGDYGLISFARNDARADLTMHSPAFGEYQDYLRTFIDGIRAGGAHPVLVSEQDERSVDSQGNLTSPLAPYRLAMHEIALESCTPFIDMRTQTLAWWDELGPDRTLELFMHIRDDESAPLLIKARRDSIHVRPKAAIECARFVARELRDQRIVPAGWVRELERKEFFMDEIGWIPHDEFQQRQREKQAPVSRDQLGYRDILSARGEQ